MPYLSHSIQFFADPEKLFECCRDVSKWANFMPAVVRAEFIETAELSDLVLITAEANNEIWTWKSKIRIKRDELTIAFERVNPIPPIEYMRGMWRIDKLTNGEVSLVLTHDFKVDQNAEMEQFITESIKRNASRDLQALKNNASTQ